MKVVVTHTDFRLYWSARLKVLRQIVFEHGADLRVIEIAGKGSPYTFAGSGDGYPEWWQCLFPGVAMEALSSREAARALWERLEDIQPDVVMAGAIAFPPGITAVRWCAANGKKCVIFDDARRIDLSNSSIKDFIKRCIYRNVAAVMIPAESHVRDYEWWGISKARLFYGVNAIDDDFFRERANRIRKEADRFRNEYVLPSKYFLGVGRQIKKKNWSVLVKAFCRYRRKVTDDAWSLVLVGNGMERSCLEELVPYDLRKDVYFVDFRTQEQLSVYYALAGVMVLPSLFGETWGIVVNEAMASGLPVLVSRECGCAQTLVQEGRNGWTFDPESVEELCDKMLMMSQQDENARRRMGLASGKIILEWGLDRFAEGAWQAIVYASKAKRKPPALIDRIIIGLWKGRYRPT